MSYTQPGMTVENVTATPIDYDRDKPFKFIMTYVQLQLSA